VIDNKNVFNDSRIAVNEDWHKDILVASFWEDGNFILNITLLVVPSKAYLEREKLFNLQVMVENASITPSSASSALASRSDEPAKFVFKWKSHSGASRYVITFCGCTLDGVCSTSTSPARISEPTSPIELEQADENGNIFSKMIGRIRRSSKAARPALGGSEYSESKSMERFYSGKVLVLGTGSSGKSIVYKQIQKYFSQFDKEQRIAMTPIIHSNILDSFTDLLETNTRLQDDQGRIFELSPAAIKAKQAVEEQLQSRIIDKGFCLTPELAKHIKTLWKDPGIKVTFERSPPESFSADAIAFYLDNILRIADTDYSPTEEDIMHCYVRTSSIMTQKYSQENGEVTFVDIGGQTASRKKWLRLITGELPIVQPQESADEKAVKVKEPKLAGVIYVVSVGEYDQTCWHDKDMLTLKDSLSAFEVIYSMPQAQNIPLYLIFNKMDLFEKKINKIPLTVCFDDWSGASTVDNVLSFIQEKFRSRLPLEKADVYFYKANALDFSSLQGTIKDILDKTKDFLGKVDLRRPPPDH
jgi:GTPase SAR1 family protein